MLVYLSLVGVFVFCGLNVVILEHLVKYSPRCGDLIAFAQFLFISSYGFVMQSKFLTKKSVVPIKEYILAVILFYTSTMCGNLALGCYIALPIQMIFRSGSVLASLILGVLVLRRRVQVTMVGKKKLHKTLTSKISYTLSKYLSVIMITIGIATCMLVSADENTENKEKTFSPAERLIWLFGIGLLVASLFLGSALGVVQEKISMKYGKHPEELLFYSHFLALPGFLFFYSNILEQAKRFSESELYTIPNTSYTIPIVWLYLGVSAITQLLCVKCVYVLATEMSSLAVTVILTLRKFVSLVVSIYYFNNPFTVYHWCGTALVFTGTLLFSGVLQKIFELFFGTGEIVEKENAKEKEKKVN